MKIYELKRLSLVQERYFTMDGRGDLAPLWYILFFIPITIPPLSRNAIIKAFLNQNTLFKSLRTRKVPLTFLPGKNTLTSFLWIHQHDEAAKFVSIHDAETCLLTQTGYEYGEENPGGCYIWRHNIHLQEAANNAPGFVVDSAAECDNTTTFMNKHSNIDGSG